MEKRSRKVFKVIWPEEITEPICIEAKVVSETFNGWMRLRGPHGEEFNARISADNWRASIADAWYRAIMIEAVRQFGILSHMKGERRKEGRFETLVMKAFNEMHDIGKLLGGLEASMRAIKRKKNATEKS